LLHSFYEMCLVTLSRNSGDIIGGIAPDEVRLLEHLGARRAHVLGTSLGGFVAQELALRRPELVGRLVLVSTCHGGRGQQRMSLGGMEEMLGFGAMSARQGVRRGHTEIHPTLEKGIADARRLPRILAEAGTAGEAVRSVC
jgi:pimeloyl-ACP methyl ester carboxylesterase